MADKNEDMAGIVSEPRSSAPEVKPAKSLWPRPYQDVRIEPSLEPVRVEVAPTVTPLVSSPADNSSERPHGAYQEPAVAAPAPAPGFDEDPLKRLQEELSQGLLHPRHEAPRFEEMHADEAQPSELEPETPAARDVPVADAQPSVASEPAAEAAESTEPPGEAPPSEERGEPGVTLVPDPDPLAEDTPAVKVEAEPIRVRADDRTTRVIGAADEEKPVLEDRSGSKRGRFVAMAAGIVVALGLGAVAFMYGASALGIKFGGSETAATTSPAPAEPVPVVAVNDDELKAAQARIVDLEARLAELEAQKTADPPAETAASVSPVEASVPAPEPAAAPAPELQESASAPKNESAPPAASASNATPAAPARAEPPPPPAPRPAESAPAAPPTAPKPRPTETARAEPAPPPPPPVQTQPPSEAPRPAATPDMPVLQNWAVRDVYNGIAVIQGYRGPLMEVEPGDELPGGNRVLAIRRLGGSWAVVTERGIIAAR